MPPVSPIGFAFSPGNPTSRVAPARVSKPHASAFVLQTSCIASESFPSIDIVGDRVGSMSLFDFTGA